MSLAEKARKAADEAVRKKQEETIAAHKMEINRWWTDIALKVEKASEGGCYDLTYTMMISRHEALPEPVLVELRRLLRAEKLTLVETSSGEPLVWTISWKKPKTYRGLKKGDSKTEAETGDDLACSCGAPSCDRCHSGG